MRDWRSAMARPIFDEIAARLAREPSVSARVMNHRHFVFLADWARIKNFVADCLDVDADGGLVGGHLLDKEGDLTAAALSCREFGSGH